MSMEEYRPWIASLFFLAGIFLIWRSLKSGQKTVLYKWFDYTINRNTYRLIGFVAVVAFFVLLFFIVIQWISGTDFRVGSENEGGGTNPILGVYYHFIDPGGQPSEKGIYQIIFAAIVSFVGMVLLSGTMISVITNILELRISNYEQGKIRYACFKDHIIIIGYNKQTPGLIKYLLQENCRLSLGNPVEGAIDTSRKTIVVLTCQDIRPIRAFIHTMFQNPKLEKQIIFYSGSRESLEELRQLCPEEAAAIFIQGEQDESGGDTKNVECARNISLYMTDFRKKKLQARLEKAEKLIWWDRKRIFELQAQLNCKVVKKTVFVQFDLQSSYDFVRHQLTPRMFRGIHFIPFNFYEMWARRLWSSFAEGEFKPLDFEPIGPDSSRRVCLLVDCYNRMGAALVQEAIRLCHFANFERSGIQTLIYVLDDQREGDCEEQFRIQYPYFEQIEDIRIEFIPHNINSLCGQRLLEKLVRSPDNLITLALCQRNADANLLKANTLLEEAYKEKVNILIRQEIYGGLAGIVDKEQNGKFKNLHCFGMLSDYFRPVMLQDTIAMYTNYAWSLPADLPENILRPQGLRVFQRKAFEKWETLSEEMKWANRYMVDSYCVYLRTLGLQQKHHAGTCPEVYHISKEELAILAPMEHRRWMAERTLAGWRQARAGEVRRDEWRIHTCIVPFRLLNEETRCKDYKPMGNLFVYIALEGVAVEKKSVSD